MIAFHASPISNRTFVRDVEVWAVRDATTFTRTTLDGFGVHTDDVVVRGATAASHRLVHRVRSSMSVEVEVASDASGGHDVALGIPFFRSRRLDSILVLRCSSPNCRGACVEVWEPSRQGELAHAEGYYGSLGTFELSSRLSRFLRGVGLPGIAWDRGRGYLLPDVRSAPTFRRAELARQSDLALGLALPVFPAAELSQVVTLITSVTTPLASAVELWIPDAGHRLWLDEAAYVPEFERLLRNVKSTCFMSGEGVVGRAYESRRPVLWSRHQRDARAIDPEALRMNSSSVVAIPSVVADEVRSVVVLRS